MWKALDITIDTNSYDKFIGICHEFILDKQGSLNSNFNIVENEFNVKNPIITANQLEGQRVVLRYKNNMLENIDIYNYWIIITKMSM